MDANPVDLIGPADLAQLAEIRDGMHVSLYAPMIRAGPQTAQNPIRWKNLLRRIEEALRRDSSSRTQFDALLDPARKLVNDRTFWEHQSDALAYFATPRWGRHFRLPIDVRPLAALGDRLLLAPLLAVLAARDKFMLLTLSQRQIRLFELTRFSIAESPITIPAGTMPAAVEDRLSRGRPNAFLADRGGSGSGVVFFGQGAGADQRRDDEIFRYFRTVDATIRPHLDVSRPLLLLAGAGHLVPIYRQASSYTYMVEDALIGNPDELSLPDLRAEAWAMLEPLWRRDEATATAEYRALEGTGMTLSDPHAVLDNAVQGRVKALVLSASTFTGPLPEADAVLRLDTDPRAIPDVLDQAVAACLANGGSVYIAPAERMPNREPIAAILRF